MNVVFFGSSEFSLKPLEAVSRSNHKLTGLVTVPPAKKGRGQKIETTHVQQWAEKKNLSYLAPARLRESEVMQWLGNQKPDAFVVASYGKILPQSVLDIPSRFALNIHPSLLPKYRGAAPLNWQIINGERECGVTFFRMTAEMDAGDVIWQKNFPLLADENAEELGERLSNEAARALPFILDQIENGKITFTPQSASVASFAPKLQKSDSRLNWAESARALHDRVRGLFPWPVAEARFRNETVRIFETRYTDDSQSASISPGKILDMARDNGLAVATGKGILFLTKLQRPGKIPTSGKDFANGARLESGEKFE